MNARILIKGLIVSLLCVVNGGGFTVISQNLDLRTGKGLEMGGFKSEEGITFPLKDDIPLFSFIISGSYLTSSQGAAILNGDHFEVNFGDTLKCEISPFKGPEKGWKAHLIIHNMTGDTIDIENIVPFGESPDLCAISYF